MANDLEIVTVKYEGCQLELHWQDLWFINEIRKLKFGTLTNVEIQDGHVVFVRKTEKKIKPGDKL